MPEKIKITRKEIDELYDITQDEELTPPIVDEITDDMKNATFEEYTELYDKKQEKEMKENA